MRRRQTFRITDHGSRITPGLSLVEVLIALVILVAVLYVTARVYIQGFTHLDGNGWRLQALECLQAELERLRVTPYFALPPEAHRLPAADKAPLAGVILGQAPLPDAPLTVRFADGSPGPTPTAVDWPTGRLTLPNLPFPCERGKGQGWGSPQTVLISYTYMSPASGEWRVASGNRAGANHPSNDRQSAIRNPQSAMEEEVSVTVTGTYLDEGLQPVLRLMPRKRLTVTVTWTTRGKGHFIEGHLLRTP